MALTSLLPHPHPSLPPSLNQIIPSRPGVHKWADDVPGSESCSLAVEGRCPSPSSQVARTREERLINWGPNHKTSRNSALPCMHERRTAQKSPSSVEWWRRAAPLSRRFVSRSLSISHADLDGFFPSLSLSPLVLPHDVRPRVRPCVAPEIMSGSFEFFATHFSTQCAAVMAQFSLRSAQPHLCR